MSAARPALASWKASTLFQPGDVPRGGRRAGRRRGLGAGCSPCCSPAAGGAAPPAPWPPPTGARMSGVVRGGSCAFGSACSASWNCALASRLLPRLRRDHARAGCAAGACACGLHLAAPAPAAASIFCFASREVARRVVAVEDLLRRLEGRRVLRRPPAPTRERGAPEEQPEHCDRERAPCGSARAVQYQSAMRVPRAPVSCSRTRRRRRSGLRLPPRTRPARGSRAAS